MGNISVPHNVAQHLPGFLKTENKNVLQRVSVAFFTTMLAMLSVSACSALAALTVDIQTGYNLVVDSNVTSPSTYAPDAAYIGAEVCNTDTSTALNNVFVYVGDQTAGTPGIYPVLDSSTLNSTVYTDVYNTGDYSITHEGGQAGSADATRFFNTIGPGECRTIYWLISYPQCVNVLDSDGSTWISDYPPCETSITGGVKPEDDITLDYDVWATADVVGTTVASQDFTMRNEISASANKIWPNTTSKVPAEYLDAIQSVIGWGTIGPDGQPLTDANPVYPGQRVITTQGIWYDMGNVGEGFDNDGDLVADHNLWMQPVGNAGSFDSSCFRLVRTYGLVIVKRSEGDILIPFENQLYFEHVPKNTGVTGLVYYQFLAMREGCSSSMTPYQEAASGRDNEKFCADFGVANDLYSGSFGASFVTKTDSVASINPTDTLTYTINATNDSGVNLGTPEYGVQLVFRDTVPAGTTYVASSADDALTKPTGTGSYEEGYLDDDDNLDTCTINFQVDDANTSYTILYSNNNGITWSDTESGTITDIQWQLFTTINTDGSHDGIDCVAPDGVYDDGSLETSLPGTSAAPYPTAEVQFQVTVDTDGGPIICNTAIMGFGNPETGTETTDCTLVTGDNTVSGTVFVDGGTGTATYGDGIQNNTTDEAGIGAAAPDGVIVTLYYDVNGDGEYDSDDIKYGETNTDANGDYSFTTLPDGLYLVEIKKYDGPTADGSDNAVIDFYPGLGNTTTDPNLSVTTDHDIIKMTEDSTTITLAVSVDLDHSSSGDSHTDVDFGFAPPLFVDKTVSNSMTSVDEGDVFDYSIILENRLPSIGHQGPTGCEYTVWASTGGTGANTKAFTNPGNAYDSATPNRSVASAAVEGGANRWLYGTTYSIPQKPGSITKIEALYFSYFNVALDDDFLDLIVGSGTVGIGNGGLTGDVTTGRISTAQIESYVGEPESTDPNDSVSWDISTLKPNGTGAVTDWSWADLPTVHLQVNPGKVAGADGKVYYLDAIGMRVTTDADCVANSSTTLSPVPLEDTYNTTSFDYISADPEPTSVNTATGEIKWDDVGPILPGNSQTVTVTLQARDVDGTVTGTCSGTLDGCNSVDTAYDSKNVYYADGRLANDDSDSISVDIVGKGEIRGTVWNDANNDGWSDDDGESGLPDVTVTLFGCMQADGALETATSKKTCLEESGTNTWEVMTTVITDANGDYQFIGLDQGTYIVEVGDTDSAPPPAAGGGNNSPYGGTQTAEPDDTQTVTGGNADGTTGVCQVNCNNSWGNEDSDLDTLNQINDSGSEETINGVDFGYYYPNATITGNIWHDVDGDAVSPPEAGETGLSGFTVELYHDLGADGTPDGAALATTTTDSNGNYSFTGLAADDYVINIIPPSLPFNVWGETHESTGGTTDLNDQIPVTVTAGQFSLSNNFGYTKTSVSNIGDSLYYDFDGDGSRDSSEQGIANISVTLYEDVDKDGTIDTGVDTVYATDVTDANGDYLFEDLATGSYIVKVDTGDTDFPSNVTATGDPDTNSASIGDFVWLDADDDGNQDAGEDGIPGVVILLYEDVDPTDGNLNTGVDKQVAAMTTDLNGNYLFTRLGAGNYFIDVDETTLPDSSLVRTSVDPATTQLTITDRTSTAITTADVGYSLAAASSLYAIGNRVWSDDDGDGTDDPGEGGIEGVDVTVQFTSCYPTCPTIYSTTSDASGYYLITGLADGTYTVAVDTNDLPGSFAPTTPAAAPANTRTITISGADDMSGDFGYRYDTDSDIATDDTGDPAGKISGTVCVDSSGNDDCDAGEGMASTRVNLYDDNFSLVASTVTDANGLYDFTGVALGIYMVEAINTSGSYSTTFLASGSEYNNLDILFDPVRKSTPDNQSGVNVSGVYADLTIDFGYQRFYGSIGDTVYLDVNENADQDFGEPGIAGVTVELYLDTDNDGVGDVLQSTTTTSVDDPLTVADEGGRFLFSNLTEPPTDQYYIIKVTESSVSGTGTVTLIGDPDTDGTPCPDLPNPDLAEDEYPPPSVCDSQQTITAFTEGINYLAADFGYSIAGANYGIIGDSLWVDTNGDGLSTGESGVPFISVYIDTGVPGFNWVDGNGNGVWDSGEGDQWVETDISGNYAFSGLADGSYTVKVLITDPDWPTGLATVPVYEADGSTDNSITAIIALGVTTISGNGCVTDCELLADIGYRYAGSNNLSGTMCVDSVIAPADGFCGDNDTDSSGINGSETALGGVEVLVYRWTDNGDNLAWDVSGNLDSNDTFVYLGNNFTDPTTGDYSLGNLPDDVVVLFTVPATDNMQLTTTNGNTSVEDASVASYQLFNGTTTYDSNTVTVLARQALDLSGDADNVIVDLDFTFDATIGGTVGYDFGDLPSAYGFTLLADGGAQHQVPINPGTGNPAPDLFLGSSISVESDGQESATATTDTYDDGVAWLNVGSWTEGVNGGSLQVTVNDTRTAPVPSSWLVAWVDFNDDSDFSDTGEMIINQAVSTGNTFIRFDIPNNGLSNSDAFARFRLFPDEPAVPVLSHKGVTTNGEVEDYLINLDATRVIGDRIWLDEDADGFQDIGEPGITGVTVDLYLDANNDGAIDGGDTNLATTITDADGRYVFDDLDNGNYLIKVTDTDSRLPGLEISPGTTDPHDVALAQNDTAYRGADFGYVPSDPQDDTDSFSAIGDFVWNDFDADGMQDNGEVGIAGVTMALVSAPGADGVYGTTDDTVAATTTTGDDGFYLFTNVIPGEYVVIADVGADNIPGNGDDSTLTETPTTGPQSVGSLISDPITVIADKSDSNADFGFNNSTDTYTISDRLWYDIDGDTNFDAAELGIGAVTVNLVKDSNGDGIADTGEPIISTVISNEDGTFTFSGVPSDGSDNYLIVISDLDSTLSSYSATTDPAALSVTAVSNLSGNVDNTNTPNFGYNRPGVIEGSVWSDANGDGVLDTNESGISGVTVILQYDSNGDGTYGGAGDDGDETEFTDDVGRYEFKRLGSGDYRVVVTPPAGTQTGDPDAIVNNQTDITLDFGDGIHHLDFGYQDASRFAISGTVFNDLDVDGTREADGDDGNGATTADNETGIGIVTLYLYTDEDGDGSIAAGDKVVATTQSAADGTYSFTGLANDDYVVAVTDQNGVLNGYELTSGLEQLPVTLAADVTGMDFGYARDAQTSTIGNLVWIDNDSDGVPDSDEEGIANVTLYLYEDTNKNGVLDAAEHDAESDKIATARTDADGLYLFDSVPAGYYFIDIDESTLSDTNLVLTTGTTDPSALIVLSEYEEYLDADFGYVPPGGKATMSGTAWADMDNDGIMDPDEIGISGVDINIWNDTAGSWLAPVITNPDGSWLLTNLDPADYVIAYNDTDTALDGFIKTPPTNLSPDTGYRLTIAADEAVTNIDFGFTNDITHGSNPGNISGTVYYDFSGNSNHEPDGTDAIPGTQDDEKGLDRVTLNLVDTVSGEIYATVTTDSNGDYSFTGVLPGSNYKVVIADQNNVLSLLNPTELLSSSITVSAGTANSGNDAGFVAENGLGTIGNKIWLDSTTTGVVGAWDIDEPGVSGVVLECWHDVNNNDNIDFGIDNLIRTETTDDNGEYYCEGIPTGNYLVYAVTKNTVVNGSLYNLIESYCSGGVCGTSSETRDNYTKVNPFALATTSPNLTADFGFKTNTSPNSISGTVFNDVNNNASGTNPEASSHPDAGDTFVVGAAVYLYRNDTLFLKTTTDASGDYTFGDLPDGTYDIEVDTDGTTVSGYEQTTQGMTNGIIEDVSVSAGQSVTGYDFGFYRRDIFPTVAIISSFRSYVENGQVVVEWETVSENGTVGFHLERLNENTGQFERINNEILPSLLTSITGGIYTYIDVTATPGKTYSYRLVEVEFTGFELEYGPWQVTTDTAQAMRAYGPQVNSDTNLDSKLYSKMKRPVATPTVKRLAKARSENERVRKLKRDERKKLSFQLKILVRNEGLHAITVEKIADFLAADTKKVRHLLRSNRFAMSYWGEQIPTTVSEDGNALLFYGAEVDSIFTDANVYLLTIGEKGKRMRAIKSSPVHDVENERQSYFHRTTIEEQKVPLIWLADDPRDDFWYWDYSIGSTSGTVNSYSIHVEEASDDGEACLTARLHGSYNDPAIPDHRMRLRINGNDIGEEAVWDGVSRYDHHVCFDQSLLKEGDNSIQIVNYKDSDVGYNVIWIDGFELDYLRQYYTTRDSLLVFGDEYDEITVSGFSSGNIMVFDLEDILQPKLVRRTKIKETETGWQVSFTPGSTETPYLAVTSDGWIYDAEIVVDKPSELLSELNRADHIIISPTEFIDAAQELADYRTSTGTVSMVVELEDIYDEFNYGIDDPWAIRDFLAYTWSNWLEPPRYVALAGKGSIDYTDMLSQGGNIIPVMLANTPWGMFANDSGFGDIDGDGIAEFAIGRIPVLSSGEFHAWTGKLIAYETASPEPWSKNILLAADDPDYAGDYHSANDNIGKLMPAEYNIDKAYLGIQTQDEFRTTLLSGFGNTGVINYFGHGSANFLAHERVLKTEDFATMNNEYRLPLFIALTCSVGMFDYPGYQSMSEAMVLHESGGAIAAYTPSGLSFNNEALKLDRALMGTLFPKEYKILGDAILEAQADYAREARYQFMLNIYNLMGDPATVLQ